MQFQVEKSLVTATTLLHSLTKPHPLQGDQKLLPRVVQDAQVHTYLHTYMF